MKIVITGGSGFIGRNITQRFILEGMKVFVLDKNLPAKSEENSLTYIKTDLLESSLLNEVLHDADILIHLASSTTPSTSNKAPIFDIESNLVCSLRILDAVRQNPKVKLIFFSSGGSVYGNPKYLPIDEDHPVRPISSYGIVKHTIEKYIELYCHLYGIKYTVLRVSNPYGAGQAFSEGFGVIPNFVYKISNNEELTVVGNGSATRDFLYIKDLVEITFKIATKDGLSKLYNIGSGVETSINSLIKIISYHLKKSPVIKYENPRLCDAANNVLDISKVKNEVAWSPQYSVEDGIKDMLVGSDTHLR